MITRISALFVTLLLLSGCAGSPGKNQDVQHATPSQNQAQQSAEQGFRNSFAGIQLRNTILRQKGSPATVQDDLWTRLRLGFDLPELDNRRVAYYEKRFTQQPEHFYAMLERAQWFLPYILTEVEKRGYPTELALLPAVESAFITDAKSRSSASGLWQFIPSTGRLYNLHENWWYDGRRDPILSTQAALQFLGELEQRFDGNWFHAIAAYNAGGGTLERAIRRNAKKKKSIHFNDLTLRKETQNYVPKLVAFRNIFLTPENYGLKLPPLNMDMRMARLDAGSQIDIALFAQKSGIDMKTMRFLNSAYRRNVTPPNGPHVVYLPMSALQDAQATLASLSTNDRLRWTHYRVNSGDVLGRIAKRHRVSVNTIKQSNQLKSNLIHPGDILLIPIIGGNTRVASSTRPASSGKVTYHVQKGDTLWDIAQRYGVKVAQLSQWNRINQSHTLKLGQKLTIYTRS